MAGGQNGRTHKHECRPSVCTLQGVHTRSPILFARRLLARACAEALQPLRLSDLSILRRRRTAAQSCPQRRNKDRVRLRPFGLHLGAVTSARSVSSSLTSSCLSFTTSQCMGSGTRRPSSAATRTRGRRRAAGPDATTRARSPLTCASRSNHARNEPANWADATPIKDTVNFAPPHKLPTKAGEDHCERRTRRWAHARRRDGGRRAVPYCSSVRDGDGEHAVLRL
jgi:hypothetical protein